MTDRGRAGFIGLVELTDRVGELCWVSRALFAVEGGWAPEMTDATATVHLATQARHHGWHAELWADTLADSPALAADTRVVAPGGWADAIEASASANDDRSRLEVLYSALVPAALDLVTALEQASAGPAAGHVRRVAGLVAADVRADLTGGAALLDRSAAGDRPHLRPAELTCSLRRMLGR